jgi:hypothetical protein
MPNYLKRARYLLFLLFNLLFAYRNYAQDLNNEQIRSIAAHLLISKNYKLHVKKVLPVINGVQVVALDMPYREFPSIIIINKDKSSGKWVRVFECLSPGIQDKPSGLLDWHTKGEGVDFMLDNMSTCRFADKKIKAVIQTSVKKDGAVIIPYQYFIHMNTAENAPAGFSPYTIDKTQYFDFANTLYDGTYKNYPVKDCTMYDTPGIKDCEFKFVNSLYTIKVITDSGQVWTYTFEGIDTQNRYLLNKKITVSKEQ